MKLLLTGANGFLGFYLSKLLLAAGHELLATGRGPCRLPYVDQTGFHYKSLELTDCNQIIEVVQNFKPDQIIHAGAIGKPDDCELNPALASHINTDGTRYLLHAAKLVGASFCYISTDFVFDGVKGNYSEEDHCNPVNHYGKTKLDAEGLTKSFEGKWSIIRTVLVYGRPMTGRSNLLSIVQEKLSKGEAYKVVNDQVRTPTFVGDLASGILAVVQSGSQGVFHISGEEIMTPYEMACQAANYLELDRSLIIETSSSSFIQSAKRPLLTGLNISKAKQELGFSPISFSEGLKHTFS